ncbi:MAG: Carbon-nitrogen hydrolase [Phylliscum demangeonii]|nr:MAG: Carbon-nitrogen hydrolase [Phylliscum demangeonii]
MVLAAIGQLCSTADPAHNLRQCQTLVRKAAAAGAKALFLPEASDYIASSAAETISLARQAHDSAFVQGLQHEARQAGVAINVGIHEPAAAAATDKVKNTVIWINEQGEIVQRYQKVHLFDVDLHHFHGPVLKESASVEPGRCILPPFDTAVGRVGLMICFDLRFPEISLALRRQHAQILAYPSAFTVPTGRAHWTVLLRARAIETQSYVIAAAQVGRHNEKRRSYGHSMVVDPWGDVVAELDGCDAGLDGESAGGGEPQLATVDIDLQRLEKVRREMPLVRRTDVYPEL